MSRENSDGGNNNERNSSGQPEGRDSDSSRSMPRYTITISGPFFQIHSPYVVPTDPIDDLFASTPLDLQRLYAEIREIGKDDPAKAIGVLLRSLSIRNHDSVGRKPTKEYHNAGRSTHPAYDIASIVSEYINRPRQLENGDTGGAILPLDNLISWGEQAMSKTEIEAPYGHVKKVENVQKAFHSQAFYG